MTRNIKILADQSYTEKILDEEKVNYIAEKLTRHELKKYIKLLKQYQNQNIVVVTTPKELKNSEKETIEKMYTNKSVEYKIDAAMIGGIKITNNDIEYEISLEKIFHDIITYLNNTN